jgi:hypothetical protein
MLNKFDSGFGASSSGSIKASVYVGDTCHDSTQTTITTGLKSGAVGKQVELWVPAYQMLEDIEANYAESHMKTITFNNYYQFNLKSIEPGGDFVHLVSNGISSLKSCLIVPLLSSLNNNVMVGGSAVFHQYYRYGYQIFNNEFFNIFGINGNESPVQLILNLGLKNLFTMLTVRVFLKNNNKPTVRYKL